MRIDILTLFPEMFTGVFETSIIKRAREQDIVDIRVTNIRDFATDKHHITDDAPFGGGGGMVMIPEPITDSIEHVLDTGPPGANRSLIYLSPQGELFSQNMAKELAELDHLILLCGRYEGVDERICDLFVDREVSIGDYVVGGGEIPAMVLIDSLVRLLPGAIGNEDSYVNDSFFTGLLDCPHYTRPREYRGLEVPDVLLSGHHKEIDKWRRQQSLERTLLRRPDLLEKTELSPEDEKYLKELRKKHNLPG
jgi:tRNA (guanine37-N1)-methyltransferase